MISSRSCAAARNVQWLSTFSPCLSCSQPSYTKTREHKSWRPNFMEWSPVFVGLLYRTCFASPFWRLEVLGGCWTLRKFVHPCTKPLHHHPPSLLSSPADRRAQCVAHMACKATTAGITQRKYTWVYPEIPGVRR
jgi:hypothetical protein